MKNSGSQLVKYSTKLASINYTTCSCDPVPKSPSMQLITSFNLNHSCTSHHLNKKTRPDPIRMDGLLLHNLLAQHRQLANRYNNANNQQIDTTTPPPVNCHIQMDQPSQLPIAAAVKKLDAASQFPHDIKQLEDYISLIFQKKSIW